MQFNDFKRIVTCFADRVDDVDTTHGELVGADPRRDDYCQVASATRRIAR